MAVINTTAIVNDIRGSVGDLTFSRNQGGLYVRNRAGPPDNPTQEQTDCRDAMSILSKYWSSDLTDQQRADWRSYAAQHPRPDQWGIPRLSNGYTSFVRHNFRFTRMTLPLVTFPDAPLQPPLSIPIQIMTASAGPDRVTISLNPANYDPPDEFLCLALSIGPQQDPGINFFNGPWVLFSTTFWFGFWSVDPWTFALANPLVQGKKVWARITAQAVMRGALSNYSHLSCVVEA